MVADKSDRIGVPSIGWKYKINYKHFLDLCSCPAPLPMNDVKIVDAATPLPLITWLTQPSTVRVEGSNVPSYENVHFVVPMKY